MRRKLRARKIYEDYHGITLPDNIEVHHIVPVHDGGTDDIFNLIALTKEQHMEAHLKRYEETKNFRDLCAYHMIGYNFTEAHKVSSSAGGKIGGNKVKKLGAGICTADKKLRSSWASKAGKIGGMIQKQKKIGIHGLSESERLMYSSMGGKVGAFVNSRIQSELGKRGGKKNKGFVWLTDGTTSIKYTKKEQQTRSVVDFIKENPQYRLGRTHINKKCSRCGKVMSARAIGRYHNERCKNENTVNN